MMNSYDSLHAPQAESGWKTWVDLTTRMRSDALSPADWEHFYPKYRSLIIMYGNKQKLSRDQIRELIDRVYDTIRAKDKISCYDPSRGRFRDYLGGIIRNCIRDLRKKARAEKRNFIVNMEELPEHSAEAPGEDEWLELAELPVQPCFGGVEASGVSPAFSNLSAVQATGARRQYCCRLCRRKPCKYLCCLQSLYKKIKRIGWGTSRGA